MFKNTINMKHFQLLLTLCLLLVSHNSFSQSNGNIESGGGSSSGTTKIFDSVPAPVLERIETYLEGRGITRAYRVANFDNKRYFVMIPLKLEGKIHRVWVDFHFDSEGECTMAVTKINSLDDAECAILGYDMCESILKFSIGFEKEFGSHYEDIIYFIEKKSGSYIEVYHPSREIDRKVKFDLQGKLIAENKIHVKVKLGISIFMWLSFNRTQF